MDEQQRENKGVEESSTPILKRISRNFLGYTSNMLQNFIMK